MIVPTGSKLKQVSPGVVRCPTCRRLLNEQEGQCAYCRDRVRADIQRRRTALLAGGRPFYLAAGLVALLLGVYLLLL